MSDNYHVTSSSRLHTDDECITQKYIHLPRYTHQLRNVLDNNNNNNFIVPIKGPRRGKELHIKQTLIQCTYNNTTFYAGQNQR